MQKINEINVYGNIQEHEIYQSVEQFSEFINEAPYIKKAALMPDCHLGYSVPIGAVFASEGYIFPAAVGYDIGCGVCGICTTFNINDVQNKSEEIFEEIYNAIPSGTAKFQKQIIPSSLNENILTPEAQIIFHKRAGFKNLGTLGSGNHFIEIGYDINYKVWIIIHSGSRGVGHGIASHYMKVASNSIKAKEGHYPLSVHSVIGKRYINDMEFCLKFALENRLIMAREAIKVMQMFISGERDYDIPLINRNHNHCTYNNGLYIHRKGATHAEEGMTGIIPGNMKDGSFIVQGLGNPDSLYSSSHGAGRILSRSKAKMNLNLDEFKTDMQGIKAKVTDSTLDESPKAYKNIFDVMKNQKDLVEIKNIVIPIINIKA